MAEEKTTEEQVALAAGDVIADTLVNIYGDGEVLKHQDNFFSLSRNVNTRIPIKYRNCLRKLISGEYTQEDLNFARQLINTRMEYQAFDLEATRRESEYRRKLLEDNNR